MEALKVPVEKEEEKGDEIELSLDLSIGGRYAKSGSNSRGKTGDRLSAQNKTSGASRSDFGCCGGDVGAEKGWDQSTNPQRRKEIQALRRQEVRKKREEKLKKSRGVNGVGSVEDKASLEAQKFQVRVQDREVRERDGFPEELGRRKAAANGNNGFAHPRVAPSCGSCGAYGKRPSSQDCDSERSNRINGGGDGKSLSNGSLERCSSAASDYQSTSGKGGNSTDTGSHSSPSHLPQHNRVPATAAPRQLQAGNDSSSPTERSSKVAASTVPHPSWTKFTDQSKPDTASASKSPPSKETCSSLVPKPPNLNHIAASSFPHMPCVSTTGNGPNSKTITGFLYRYTNNEVSIMCVCHGSSFSPAEFVEHAGGVNVSNPLMHITVVASSLGCS